MSDFTRLSVLLETFALITSSHRRILNEHGKISEAFWHLWSMSMELSYLQVDVWRLGIGLAFCGEIRMVGWKEWLGDEVSTMQQ